MLFITSHEVAFMTCIAAWEIRTQLQTASSCLWLELSRRRGRLSVTSSSLLSHGGRELDGAGAVPAAAGSSDAGSFHDCGRSLR